jgi:hypothetical protein
MLACIMSYAECLANLRVCESQWGGHADRFVFWCRSHATMGLNPLGHVAKGADED